MRSKLTTNEFSQLANISMPTVKRKIKSIRENPEQQNKCLTKMGNRIWLSSELLSEYIHPYFLNKEQENMELRKENEILRKYQLNKEEADYTIGWVDTLMNYDWDLTGTVTYSDSILRKRQTCIQKFMNLHKRLTELDYQIIMFVTTERNNDGGFHNHFLVHCSNKEITNRVKKFIDGFFRSKGRFQRDKTDITRVKYNMGAIKYCVKEIYFNKDDYAILIHSASSFLPENRLAA